MLLFYFIDIDNSIMLKIYFAGSIRGGRTDAELYRRMIEYLKKDKKQELDEELQMIRMALADNKTAKVQMIFFKPDGKKSGGSYETITGNIKKIDEYNGLIVFDDKTTVKIEKVIDILEV